MVEKMYNPQSLWTYLFLWILSQFENQATRVSQYNILPKLHNIHRADFTATFPEVESIVGCGARCTRTKGCLSFGFNSIDNTCSLFPNSLRCQTITGMYMTENGMIHYDLDDETAGSACPCSYTFDSSVGICYKYHANFGNNWTVSNRTCYEEGGYLIRIDSAVKQAFLENFLGSFASNDRIWIQGRRYNGKWRYDDGTEMTYFNWYTDPWDPEPDNTALEVVICLIQATQSTWHDRYISRSDSGFLCEIPLGET